MHTNHTAIARNMPKIDDGTPWQVEVLKLEWPGVDIVASTTK